MNKTMLTALCAYMLFGTAVFAAEKASGLFPEAAQAYQEGKCAEAAKLYTDILKEDPAAPHILYNYGNALFKTGRKGRALAAYYKAAKYMPSDEDLQANIRYTEGLLGLSPYQESEKLYLRICAMADRIFPFLLFVLFFSVCLIAAAFIAFIRLSQGRNPFNGFAVFCLIAALLSAVPLTGILYMRYIRQQAVVLENTTARYGPSLRDTAAFELTEGQTVRIKDTYNQWTRVQNPSGASGWVPTDTIESV